MTSIYNARIVRFWTGTPCSVIAIVPSKVLQYHPKGAPGPHVTWRETSKELDCYVYTSDVKGQLIASLCKDACEKHTPVRLTIEHTTDGLLVTHVELITAELEAAS